MSLLARFLMCLTVVAAIADTPRAAAVAGAPEPLDWIAWRGLPVYDAGRVMPLDTFARSWVEEICGRSNPRLAPAESDAAVASPGGAGEASPLFPGGKSRKYTAAELVFSWLVEPERWEDVPLLLATHETLRRDWLQAPLVDARGNRMQFVSPRYFEQAARAQKRLAELARLQQEAEERGFPFELTEADRQLERLDRAYHAFRQIAIDPKGPEKRRALFVRRLTRLSSTWRGELAHPLALWQALDHPPEAKRLVDGIQASVASLVELLENESYSLRAAETPAARLAQLARSLAALVDRDRQRPFDSDNPQMVKEHRALMDLLARGASRLLAQSLALRAALDDDRHEPKVVPRLSPFALKDDDRMGRKASPWMSLEMLLSAPKADLSGYPAAKVDAVREAFDRARSAWFDRAKPDRPARFNQAMGDLAGALRGLATAIEPARRKLLADDDPEDEKTNQALLAATAYPPAAAMDREVFYNRFDPFLWSWVVTFASMVILSLGFGSLRRPMFFIGAAVLAAGQGFTIAGLLFRASITGMVPVTNMYETVLFTAAAVALLALWFALLPITWPIIAAAWRVTAVSPTPQTAASVGFSGDNARWFWRTMPIFRLLLTPVVFYVLAMADFNPSENGPLFPLRPTFASGSLAGMAGAMAIWLVGLALLGWSLWFFPRALLAIPLAVTTMPRGVWILATQRLSRPIEQVVARRPLLLAGAVAALLAYLLAYYVPGPVFDRDVGMGMAAVLRSNFWLALHVLIVTASYGAGVLAWALALISLGYYALGRYRTPPRPSAETLASGHRPAGDYRAPESAFARRPPAICAKLATYLYKIIQVAVLLLAAGTITGAIWADYAWGRYWGWDPKEVWALVSLLVYLVVLHGRWAGWTGNFGLAVGAVLGAMAILMTWYGVNFLLRSGLHSYGHSTGGAAYVAIAVIANLALVALATVRYWSERAATVKVDIPAEKSE